MSLKLLDELKSLSSLAVAFSGGVDSTLLLSMAVEALGARVLAVTAFSPIHSRREIADAIDIAGRLGCRHLLLRSLEMERREFRRNPADRCYICKQGLLRQIQAASARRGFSRLAHGVNVDDLEDYRPGLRAAEELGVLAPLAAAGMTKRKVRQMARERGLANWDRPAMACLATRIPHDTPITPALLDRIASAEECLRQRGFVGFRVRCHGDVARIECRVEDLGRMLNRSVRSQIVHRFRAVGFRYITVDLEGYRQGSMNPHTV
ncbi:MAG: ATP-dependent sacrificial sulfur transferase LarE [Desulfobacterales bacterium]|nr:ATP-dependent sacrificial sulfur transferase LarE [Desulfobacterales bacterium]